ncbi:hypothetical protein BDV18DRAFT_36869 [Aspergillus unguis]
METYWVYVIKYIDKHSRAVLLDCPPGPTTIDGQARSASSENKPGFKLSVGLEALPSRKMDSYTEQEKTARERAARTTKGECKTCSLPGDGCTGRLINPSTNTGNVRWSLLPHYLILRGVLLLFIPLLRLTLPC